MVLHSTSYGKTIGSIPTKGSGVLLIEIEISRSAKYFYFYPSPHCSGCSA